MRKLIRVDKEKAVISLGRFQPIKTVSYMDGGGRLCASPVVKCSLNHTKPFEVNTVRL